MRIRILVVEDHELVRRQICEMLAEEPDFDVVCEASAGFEAVRQAETYQPDVVLLDIALPELNGFQAAPLIIKVAPEAKILVLTQHDHPFFKRQALASGALGFLTKDKAGTELLNAVRTVSSMGPFPRAV